jgi:hypothetical protein
MLNCCVDMELLPDKGMEECCDTTHTEGLCMHYTIQTDRHTHTQRRCVYALYTIQTHTNTIVSGRVCGMEERRDDKVVDASARVDVASLLFDFPVLLRTAVSARPVAPRLPCKCKSQSCVYMSGCVA